jgi:hypothetical protein
MAKGFIDQSNWGDLRRRVFDDHVDWVPRWVLKDHHVNYWLYSVHRYPFVPDYHIVQHTGVDFFDDCYIVISTHKTLAEAASILKILLANGGIVYDE